jgi:hypothetical protein
MGRGWSAPQARDHRPSPPVCRAGTFHFFPTFRFVAGRMHMIRIVMIGVIAALGISPSIAETEVPVQQVQFRGGPSGQCPDGYDFNYNNGRCFPNDYRAPGSYAADPYRSRRGYGYGSCPDGYDFNANSGQCYPNSQLGRRRYYRD